MVVVVIAVKYLDGLSRSYTERFQSGKGFSWLDCRLIISNDDHAATQGWICSRLSADQILGLKSYYVSILSQLGLQAPCCVRCWVHAFGYQGSPPAAPGSEVRIKNR